MLTNLKHITLMTTKDIVDAWARIRTIDQTIPDDVLDFMKDSALKALAESQEDERQYIVFIPMDKRRDGNPYIGEDGFLRMPNTKDLLLYTLEEAKEKAKLFDGKYRLRS